jgi:3-hydroxyacyl-[acyl-carrier-protein] dehydratase
MPSLDIQAIRDILPHRFPMLLVDRIEELEADRVVGIKNVTANEPFFVGHFPDFPVPSSANQCGPATSFASK